MKHITFRPILPKQRIPHIITLFEYNNIGKEGYILFDGFYYVNNTSYIHDMKLSHCRFKESLPQTLEMYIDYICYKVEFYKREIIESTDDLANILEPDFQPTDKQKLYFRILN